MKVEDCPFSETNKDYPYEGMVTQHKCTIKPTLKLVCDEEANRECNLLEAMRNDKELLKQMREWTEQREDEI